ncbi:hypothetical protein Lsai_1812 [Legionella sainthelensi]|uniref:Uncharacterized protein n=1 Tax=Legionella sainthelensi TaxID=28087 RepID=A0A0W0YJS6_9GAMM|nr:hypothetical protein [Legionella sainthelensi]KTD56835.1 hypothetical protein Lsai_1812 [Legionella sainthelensi]VEH37029.1 Uncharacterised protein [Legionella sainthelensi]
MMAKVERGKCKKSKIHSKSLVGTSSPSNELASTGDIEINSNIEDISTPYLWTALESGSYNKGCNSNATSSIDLAPGFAKNSNSLMFFRASPEETKQEYPSVRLKKRYRDERRQREV